MHRIEPGKPLTRYRKCGEIGLELIKEITDSGICILFVTDQPLGDQLLDVGTSQGETDPVPVLDLIKGVLMNLACLFNPFLQRGNDPQWECARLFPEVLQKADIFIVRSCVGLGTQELGELVHQNNEASKTLILQDGFELQKRLMSGFCTFEFVDHFIPERSEKGAESNVF